MSDADDLTRLREVAEAATPGPWMWTVSEDRKWTEVWNDSDDRGPVARCTDDDIAEFIATFDPPTVAALIDRVERAERERDRLDGELSLARGTFELMRDELAALRAAVEGLADEWTKKHHTSPSRQRGSGPTLTFAGAATELRALLAKATTEENG